MGGFLHDKLLIYLMCRNWLFYKEQSLKVVVNTILFFFSSLKERDKAARIIQAVVLNFLTRRRLQKRVSAALVIQTCWRRVSAQRKLLMLKNEKLAKLHSASASLIQVRYSGVKLQLKACMPSLAKKELCDWCIWGSVLGSCRSQI